MTTHTKALYRPQEVSAMLGIPESTLRFWSKTFPQINPKTTAAGHRRYTMEDIETCRQIMFLLREKGLSIDYAMREMGKQRKYPPRQPRKCTNTSEAIALLEEVCEATEDPHMASAIDSVIGFLNRLKNAGGGKD